MMVVGGSPANFNYVNALGSTGLFVAGTAVDITSGSPVIDPTLIPMNDLGTGIYEGVFTPQAGHFYILISAVYQDSEFTMIDNTYAPAAVQMDTFLNNNTQFSFNYAVYDFNASLTINATVMDITDSTEDSFTMVYATLGVYFGMYTGAVNKNYLATKIPTDSGYAPAADSFQCFTVYGGAVIVLKNALLEGQSTRAVLMETV